MFLGLSKMMEEWIFIQIDFMLFKKYFAIRANVSVIFVVGDVLVVVMPTIASLKDL